VNILLTGGAGYIGSHTAVVLSQAGHEVVLLDNFCNSRKSVLERLQKILGKALLCIEGDVRDTALVAKTLQDYKIDAVIHFAGLKAVGESTSDPILYYDNNVGGSISLLKAMSFANVKKLVFSSSATVYGVPQYLPYDEEHPTNPMNPYGWTKLQVEQILGTLVKSQPDWSIASLRYFNPVGAHESGLIGEAPNGAPNNLMPYLSRVASGSLPYLTIYGGDYETPDGTGVRDYVHVMDLAEGHLAAIRFIENSMGLEIFNLGVGHGYSVLQMVEAFEIASSKKIRYQIGPRRSGDLSIYFSKTEKIKKFMGWKAHRNLEDICNSIWCYENDLQCKSAPDSIITR
jgi:UDP-glucose 4-epimerase